jgi:hypothetical protein
MHDELPTARQVPPCVSPTYCKSVCRRHSDSSRWASCCCLSVVEYVCIVVCESQTLRSRHCLVAPPRIEWSALTKSHHRFAAQASNGNADEAVNLHMESQGVYDSTDDGSLSAAPSRPRLPTSAVKREHDGGNVDAVRAPLAARMVSQAW